MNPLFWTCAATALWALAILSAFFLVLIHKGKPKDLSVASGSIAKGVLYSNTVAMMPQNKESAYLHWPSYGAGIVFHIGNFTGLLLFLICMLSAIFNWTLPFWLNLIFAIVLIPGFICGAVILIKRIINVPLRSLSHFDDYFSNLLCTAFQITGCLAAAGITSSTPFLIASACLMFWMPLGKIRHLVYYFAARYHLGFFYGRRNTWPPAKNI